MATALLRRAPDSDFNSEVKWVEEWAEDQSGHKVKLYVLEATDGSIDGRPYIPETPVVPRDRDAVPACRLAVRLHRRPEPGEEILGPLIDEGFLSLVLSLDLALTKPYRPQFARDVTFGMATQNKQLAAARSAGAGARVTLACTLDRGGVLDVLGAFDGQPSQIGIRTGFDLQGTGAPTRYLKFEHPLGAIAVGLFEGVDRARAVTFFVPIADGAGYEPLPPLVKITRARTLPRGSERVPVMISEGGLKPVSAFLSPHSLVASNSHALIASEVVQPVGTTPGGVHVALANDIVLATSLPPANAPQHLPLVTDPLGPLFVDQGDSGGFWYAPAFTLLTPAANDDPATSSFVFSFSRTGMTAGPSPRPTLSGSVRFVLRQGISPETKAAISSHDNPRVQPVPLNGLTVTLDVPYMDGSELKVQSLRAELQREGDTVAATIPLLDDAVRMVYGSLAYPDAFQSQPARVRVAYSFSAYLPVPQSWPQVVFGGKVALTPAALATQVVRGQPDVSRPLLLAKPPLLVSSEAAILVMRPKYAIRSTVREQSIDAKFPCTNFGSFYLQDTDQGRTAIGCSDVLKLGEIQVKLYSEIAELRNASYRVFRALTQPGLFLVVPAAYRIARFGPNDGADKAYRPSIMVYSVIDPDATKNKFFFVATLQPDISVAARINLETELVSQTPHGQSPVIEYPTELAYSTPPVFSWILPQAIDQPRVQMLADAFSIGLTTDMDSALLLINLIQQTGLTGSVTFAFPDGTSLQSALVVDTQITGPWDSGPIDIQIAGNSVTLTNKIERPVNVFDLFTRRGTDPPESNAVTATLAPAGSQSVSISHPVDMAYCSLSVASVPMKLEELDIFVEDVSTNVIFINQVALNAHGLKGLSAKARLKNMDHIYTLDDVSGASTTLPITLPLTNYLAAQTLQYQITKIATDGSSSNTAWLEADLSKSNIVSVTWGLIQS
jgi:hypothetical protein